MLRTSSRIRGLRNLGVTEVDRAALQQGGQFAFDHDEIQTRNMARLEFDEHIDITVRLKIVPQDRAEQRQPLYVVPDAKRREGLGID